MYFSRFGNGHLDYRSMAILVFQSNKANYAIAMKDLSWSAGELVVGLDDRERV